METIAAVQPMRRPRFRRASEPPAFRLTDDDVDIIREVARHRLIRSTHIAALVGRSLDRTNDRLMRLFHAGYVDRPRAQLDRFPTSGSAPYVYALADRGARLLCERDGLCDTTELSRKNRQAGRPFIEHQIEIVNFQVALERAVRDRPDLRLIHPDEMIAGSGRTAKGAGAFALRAKLTERGKVRERSVIPDFVFGLALADGSRRNFMVEIDRGTMRVRGSNPEQTSFEGKMRVYLSAHAARQHERQFGWKNFRVLTVTTEPQRVRKMQEALRDLRAVGGSSPSLFLFATFDDFQSATPIEGQWRDAHGRGGLLI
jgi:hypothetical protein